MKKYLTKAPALISFRNRDIVLCILLILGYFTLASNKIVFSNTALDKLNRLDIIPCASNSFFNGPFDPLLEEIQINDNLFI